MKLLIPLSEISESGLEKVFDNQDLWLDPIKEFNIPCSILEPIHARLFLLKQAEGCFIRGKLEATVVLPCDRCGEEAQYPISVNFEEFEELPDFFSSKDQLDDQEELEKKSSLIFYDSYSHAQLDIGTLLWEEFSLALPIKPLCSKTCAGICPQCGANKNKQMCTCDTSNTDPRFEKLKNFKINTK